MAERGSVQLDVSNTNPEGTMLSTVTEIWKLEDNGKLLFIDRNVDQGTMKYNIKAYFDKIKE